MVGFHQRYHHRKPVTAKSLMLGDDLLACVLGGVYTDVEKTMIEIQHSTIVQETRNAFQDAMQDKFISAVERSPVGECWPSSPTTTSGRTSRSSCSSSVHPSWEQTPPSELGAVVWDVAQPKSLRGHHPSGERVASWDPSRYVAPWRA